MFGKTSWCFRQQSSAAGINLNARDGNKTRNGSAMKTTPQHDRPSISSLISGIVRDAATLINKEIAAARLEIRDEMNKARSAALLVGIAVVALIIGAILFCLMAVHLLQTLTGFDLWICYAIVGAALVALGIMVLYGAKHRVGKTRLVPARSVENTKEDARWITNRVKFDAK
jgi:VIT1/CCC1 family predicted Fe2+/Mn2+ transporter